jgi:hypothetical protein
MNLWTATLLLTSWKGTQALTLAMYAGKLLEFCGKDDIVVLCVMILCSLLGGPSRINFIQSLSVGTEGTSEPWQMS